MTPWYEQPRFDHLLVGGVVALHGSAVWVFDAGDLLMWGGRDHRLGLYRLLAGVASLILTVGAAALALYVGGGGRRLAWFRREHGADGLAVMFAVVPALLGLVGLAIIAYVLDVGGGGSWIRWPVEYSALLVAGRLARVGLIYRSQLDAQLHDSVDSHQQNEMAKRG